MMRLKKGLGVGVEFQAEINIIRQSGLFLADWYINQHPQASTAETDGITHFCRIGWREAVRPNPYFHPQWYLNRYP
ncbi:MAG: hypothetical protein KGH70_08940, partial [Rhodospirillales bacterium]|nr:hypothetical protein [Rhodospirillales bacterium]